MSSLIDVTEIFSDEDFNDTITIGGVNGLAVVWPEDPQSINDWFNGFSGLPAEKTKVEAIHFVTNIDFASIPGNNQALTVVWKSRNWIARVVKDFGHWGAGFKECVAVCLPALYPHAVTVWSPPVGDGYGGLVFGSPVVKQARWHNKADSKSTDKNRLESTANMIYFSENIAVDSWVFFGTSTATDPREIGSRVTSSRSQVTHDGTFTEFEVMA